MMFMRLKFLLLIILGSVTLQVQAQTRPPLTLNEAILLSLQNNYDIQLTRNDSLLAALDYAYANYSLLPRINAENDVL